MPRSEAARLKTKATTLHAQLVRARGRCESCGRTDSLQCAHIISRRYSATRCRLDNAFCLCARCHMHYTEWPIEFGSFVIEQIGANAYDDLMAAANAGPPLKGAAWWQHELDRLTDA